MGSALLRSLFHYINCLRQNLSFTWVQYEAGNDLPWRLKEIPTGGGCWDHNGSFNLRFYSNDGRYKEIAAQKTLRIEVSDRSDKRGPTSSLAV
jgi:hypothetical protein